MEPEDYTYKVRRSVDVEWLRAEIMWWRDRSERADRFTTLVGKGAEGLLAAARAVVVARDKNGSGILPMFELDAEIEALRPYTGTGVASDGGEG